MSFRTTQTTLFSPLKSFGFFCLFLLLTINLWSQSIPPLNYYLPDIAYNASIPTPSDYLGYQIGNRHITHDQLLGYARLLAEKSDRVVIEEYAKSHEGRPLVVLKITSKKNIDNIESIRKSHLDYLSGKTKSKSSLPVVVYQGYSVHGDEPSGGNAAALVAYYLAAAQSKEVNNLLENAIILLDPCFNPDGFQRYATWANAHRSTTKNTDPQDLEFNEPWPTGRTNHYWFDLNRDWLPVQHPESKGRIRLFHQWKPHILTDHHEMGKDASYFFQPGIPSRTNPFTPNENQQLTGKIAEFHGKALDKVGSLYYTRESFDDFYYGKGSTYPDINGSVGILFEQAGSEGQLQETDNGLLSFPFSIRNQVITSLSTQEAALGLRSELLEYTRNFYNEKMVSSKSALMEAYRLETHDDKNAAKEFIEIMQAHGIEVYHDDEQRLVIPKNQSQQSLVKAMFEPLTTFQDSLFYDVSAWTLPMAFNFPTEVISTSREKLLEISFKKSEKSIEKSKIGHLIKWNDLLSPRFLYQLLNKGIATKLAMQPFSIDGKTAFSAGTIFIPAAQNAEKDVIGLLNKLSTETNIEVISVQKGLTNTGMDMGSRNFKPITKPTIMMVAGDGIRSYDAGELWHLLDTRWHIPVTKIPPREVNKSNLDRYNIILLPDGNYRHINATGVTKIKDFVKKGGTIVAFGNAIKWANAKGLANIGFEAAKQIYFGKRPYAMMQNDRGAQYIGGAIFEVELDLTHPINFGYQSATLPVFKRGTVFMKPTKNAYATPQNYTKAPLLSGYISKPNIEVLSGSPNVIISGIGKGKVIAMGNLPNFRAFWMGTNKMLANALFFGHLIDGGATEY